MNDEEIIERLTAVRGIGRWTVEMLLLFELGRLDVWPVADYGVQKGFAKTFGRKKLPTPKQFLKIGEKWRPYRSVAAWYFWRALDAPEASGAASSRVKSLSSIRLPMLKGDMRVSLIKSAGVAAPTKRNVKRL